MFQNWGFLLAEIWGLLAIAALIGLLAGWLIWGGAPRAAVAVADAMPQPAPIAKGKPAGLTAPRGGAADNLKQIKGIGPELEKLCHRLGFYHFDQIASWTADEVAWVDENLEGFKGRVTRDDWVGQARALAGGKTA